ncbi:MAG: rane protein [Alphaproteobacteria bacterium]|nr:rane protein [Alphaproteobacteria bacterium]
MRDENILDRRDHAVAPPSQVSGLRRRGSFPSWPFVVRLFRWSTRNGRAAEPDRVSRMGWLRAAVLGANDGLVSVASIVVGVAAGAGSQNHVLLSGVAGLVAGGLSMAAGEFVSVSSQADTERAELAREAEDLRIRPDFELNQLADIYVARGVERALALQVAAQMTRRDALGAHARDELGLSEALAARPLQAAFASALSFTMGGAVPLLAALVPDKVGMIASVTAATLLCLALLGAIGARLGGAKTGRAVWRVTFWGALAMAGTAGAGSLFGVLVQ